MTLPNLLSISRVFLLIPIIFLFEKEFYVLACIFFIVASLTDFFDGYIARKRNLESDLGGLLDLLANKSNKPPRSDSKFLFLAMYPSKKSVKDATIKKIHART